MIKGAKRYLNEKRILNMSLGTYHVYSNENKLIRDILTNNGFKDVKYEDGITYGYI